MANNIGRVKVREQEPFIRGKNFEEVCLGYNSEEAILEASRCLNCKNPKCVSACPVKIKIPSFIEKIKGGNFYESFEILSEDTSLPAVCGRVCPQETQCEGSCILGIKGEAVAIGKLERFVADYVRHNPKVLKSNEIIRNGLKVAVIGSGPAGLACAYDLAKMGYDITIFESLHKPGGVLTYGIPEFRLPKAEVVEKEIDKLKDLGIKIETDVFIGRTITIDELFDQENFKAAFIGSGAGLPQFPNVIGENLNGVFSANEFLTRNNLMRAFDNEYDTPFFCGKKVCVVGGGNVAMDAARTALRCGAEVTLVYRRSEKELPARREEVHHAVEEGVKFELLTNPIEIKGDEKGWVKSIVCVRMELGEPDSSGRRSPIPIKGSEFEIETDSVIVALGTKINRIIADTTPGMEVDSKGRIIVENTATSRKGVFAGGDVVTGAATVILAMGEGRKAASAIDKYIKSLK